MGWITAHPLPLQGSARGSTGSASGSTGSASGSTSKPQTIGAGAPWKRDSLASDMVGLVQVVSAVKPPGFNA